MTRERPVHWGLSAYPLSAACRGQMEARLGVGLEVAVLSDMRQSGLGAVFRRLLGTRFPVGYVLYEDAASGPILPLLQFLVSITRCRRLAVVGPDGTSTAFGRSAGIAGLLRVLRGSISGAWAALTCRLELGRLRRAPRPCVRPPAVRRVGYLKTNLWFGLKAGGSVGHVAGVVNALSRRLGRIDVVSTDRPPMLDPGVPVHPVPARGPFGYPYEVNYYTYHRAFVREARRVLRKSRPDVLYHRLSLASYAGVRLARELGTPLVIEYNGSEVWIAQHWGRPLQLPRLARLAEDLSLRDADLIVTVSEVLGAELRARGVLPERILVHPNCVDAEQFDPERFSLADRQALRARHGIPDEAVVCGFIGTFGVWHGVTLLAEAIRVLADRDEPWLRARGVRFLLIGDGALMPRVREILAAPRVAPYVTLTGLVEQHAAPAYLAAADIVLSPHVPNPDGSPFFGSPMKIFEYMAMAKGIVASELDQIGDVLRQSYRASALPAGPCPADETRLAVLVAPGNRQELIAGLRFLVDRPDYREALGENARREARARYTWERNVTAVLDRLAGLG